MQLRTHHNERNQNVEHDKDSDRRGDIGLRLVQRHVGKHGLARENRRSNVWDSQTQNYRVRETMQCLRCEDWCTMLEEVHTSRELWLIANAVWMGRADRQRRYLHLARPVLLDIGDAERTDGDETDADDERDEDE